MTNTPTQAAVEAAARAIENGSAEEWEALPVIHKQVFRAHAKNAIEAYRAAMREAGFVEVPVEPTNKMIGQGWAEALGNGATGLECIEEIYRAMIAARPQIGGE